MNKKIRFNQLVLRFAAVVALLAVLSSAFVGDVSGSPAPSYPLDVIPWEPGSFEIRIFDVDQGDSQLIIFPSGFTLLIDVGEPSYNTDKMAVMVAAQIRALTGDSHIDVGLLTHLDRDHIGYVEYGGFWALIEEQGITFDKIIDRDAGVWVDGYGGGIVDGLCDPDLEIDWHNAGEVTNTARLWLCYATDPANALIYDWRELAQLGSTTQIDPPDADVTVTIIQVDAAGVLMQDGVTPVAGDHTLDSGAPSENDYSISVKITFGDIDYITGGDTSGTYEENYNNVETVIADWIGPVELMHVNHHGSSHSTNQYYLDTLNPDDTFISCGNNSYGHPAQEVLDRLTATAKVYQTNLCDPTRDYTGVTITNSDIIIRSTDGFIYEIFYRHWLHLPILLKP